MFELSDDEDDHFWNDIPLNDITVKTNTINGPTVKKPQLRVPEASCSGPPAKKLCTESNFNRDQVAPSCNQSDNQPRKDPIRSDTSSHHNASIKSTEVTPDTDRLSRGPLQVLGESPVDYVTPKRKRKFPGPAGVLPKLMPGQSFDMGSLNMPSSENRPKENKSPQEETVVLCSQTSENLFQDDPWQALLKDIGEEGLGIMRKFSIASTLLKAGKKQLYQGKAWLLFGIIESLENHGSEASASIKDRSGKMHGTIHNDLMTEYEAELQVGTVLVLKQVSIISISNKNHYLNITPNNLVSLYHVRENTLKSLHFHGSQDSLHSVLKALEKESTTRREQTPDSSALSRRSMMPRNTSCIAQCNTPGYEHVTTQPVTPVNKSIVQPGASRRSLISSGTSTPALSAGSPAGQTVNRSSLFNTHASSYTPTRNQHVSVPGVRDVSVTPRNTALIGQSNTPGYKHVTTQPVTPVNRPVIAQSYNKPVNSHGAHSNINSSIQQNSFVPRNTGTNNTVSNMNVPFVNSTPQQSRTSSINNAIPNSTPSGQTASKWRFRSPSSSVVNSPKVNSSTPVIRNSSLHNQSSEINNTVMSRIQDNRLQDRLPASGRACQLQISSDSSVKDNVMQDCNTDIIRNNNNCVSEKRLTHKEPDLWEDDLSDDILSQLTDDMT